MYKIVANWKMYLSIQASRELAMQISNWWQNNPCPNIELIISPSALAIHDVRPSLERASIAIASQELAFSTQAGAFTGQIGADQLLESGVSHAIIGHSEMREFFSLSDAMINQQVGNALKHDLVPIICVGETREERLVGRTDQVLVAQLEAALSGHEFAQKQCLIAYEPRWAIGTGKPVDPDEAERVHQLILHTVSPFFLGREQGAQVLYGGSVDASNVLDFLKRPSVAGALVGSASVKMKEFQTLLKTLEQSFC
jgi:triosephosphate isomerase